MKKNILTTLVACILVAALAVGGTLAYMTATDSKVTNTFVFANGISVDLYELKPTPVKNEKIETGNQETGWKYENVVPGQDLNKKPEVKVQTSVDAYVFVKLSGFTANVISLPTGSLNDNWTAMTDVDSNGNGTYVYKNVISGTGTVAETSLGEIITKVHVGAQATAEQVNAAQIGIQVAAIQATGFTSAADALTTGAPTFQGTVTPDTTT